MGVGGTGIAAPVLVFKNKIWIFFFFYAFIFLLDIQE